jgi:hypothetical protein
MLMLAQAAQLAQTPSDQRRATLAGTAGNADDAGAGSPSWLEQPAGSEQPTGVAGGVRVRCYGIKAAVPALGSRNGSAKQMLLQSMLARDATGTILLPVGLSVPGW